MVDDVVELAWEGRVHVSQRRWLGAAT
jgi:hypothetical protein